MSLRRWPAVAFNFTSEIQYNNIYIYTLSARRGSRHEQLKSLFGTNIYGTSGGIGGQAYKKNANVINETTAQNKGMRKKE